jgi:hypothetical protein
LCEWCKGRGINGKGIKTKNTAERINEVELSSEQVVFIPLPFIPLPSSSIALECDEFDSGVIQVDPLYCFEFGKRKQAAQV